MSNLDELSNALQNEAIKISENRLKKQLPRTLIENIRTPRSYIGLEMILDTVRTIEIAKLELYLADLNK